MKKRQKAREVDISDAEPTAEAVEGGKKPEKEFPPLPVSDAAAAGLIAAVFALIGAVIAVRAASRDKEPKPKKPKKAKSL